MESDFLFGRKRSWSDQWLEFLPDRAEGFVVLHELGIHLGELFEHIRMGQEQFALLDESAHDMDAHFYGFGAAQHIGVHEGPMLGEGVGTGLGELEAGEVVAICDHLFFLLRGKLKDEVGGESLSVALHLFVEVPADADWVAA